MANKVVLRAFPTEISEYIELPDMAELLLQPIFYDTDIEDAWKYGTEFQRNLINKTPLRNTKKQLSVLSQVRMIIPNYRSCTNVADTPDYEWHIDCEEKQNGVYHYNNPSDYVHLLTSDCSSMTEFNKNEIITEFDDSLSITDFLKELRKDMSMIEGKSMPHNQIVTFRNHMHRATNPQKIEFKYMWRVVETDRLRDSGRYNPRKAATYITGPNGEEINVLLDSEKVTIFIPSPVREMISNTRVHMEPTEEELAVTPEPVPATVAIPEPTPTPVTAVIEENDEFMDQFPSLSDFIPLETVRVVVPVISMAWEKFDGVDTLTFKGKLEEGIDWQDFLTSFDKSIKIAETDMPDNGFNMAILKVDMDHQTRIITGAVAIPWVETVHLKENNFYFLEFSKTAACRFESSDEVTAQYVKY